MDRQQTTRKPGEAGYTLLAVIFLLFLLTLALSVAMPHMAKSIQLDRERETMHRGLQYRRAIQLYYRKFHAYPPNLDALVKTQEIRFLRKKYVDPTTGKAEWKPILFGQAKTQTLGFFGEPLAGSGSAGSSVMAGTGPSGGGSTTSGSSSLFGSSATSSTGATDSSSTGSGSGSSGSGISGSGISGTSGANSSAFGSSGSSSSSTSSSPGGQTFGGAGIIGFSPMSSKQSILLYKKKNHFNEWEFTYDPLSDQKMISSSTGALGSSSGSSTSGTSSTGFGSSSNGSSSSGSSFGSSTSGSIGTQ